MPLNVIFFNSTIDFEVLRKKVTFALFCNCGFGFLGEFLHAIGFLITRMYLHVFPKHFPLRWIQIELFFLIRSFWGNLPFPAITIIPCVEHGEKLTFDVLVFQFKTLQQIISDKNHLAHTHTHTHVVRGESFFLTRPEWWQKRTAQIWRNHILRFSCMYWFSFDLSWTRTWPRHRILQPHLVPGRKCTDWNRATR